MRCRSDMDETVPTPPIVGTSCRAFERLHRGVVSSVCNLPRLEDSSSQQHVSQQQKRQTADQGLVPAFSSRRARENSEWKYLMLYLTSTLTNTASSIVAERTDRQIYPNLRQALHLKCSTPRANSIPARCDGRGDKRTDRWTSLLPCLTVYGIRSVANFLGKANVSYGTGEGLERW